jgi:signal transduction histidine kinase
MPATETEAADELPTYFGDETPSKMRVSSGTLPILESGNDVTADLAALQADLDVSLRLEDLLADLASRLMNQPSAEGLADEIALAQRRLCDLLGFDRSAVWRLLESPEESLRLGHMVRPDAAATPPSEMNAAAQFPYVVGRIKAGEAVFVTRLADLPAEAAVDRATLEHYRTTSTAILPLRAGGRVFAALTFAILGEERTWTPAVVQRLELVAQVFAAALARTSADVALREVTGRLIRAQEKERARLAQELHDGMSQQLAVLAVELQLLGLRPPATVDALRARLDALSEQVKALSSDVHRISHDLHPAKLERLGLVAAVRGFCRELGAAESMQVQFSTERVPATIPRDQALALYRVAQESLWNVARHSGATHATVSLSGDGAGLRLIVRDDGCGFDPVAVAATASLGLLGMGERVGVLGGQIRWHTAPGRGTTVDVRMPLPSPHGT